MIADNEAGVDDGFGPERQPLGRRSTDGLPVRFATLAERVEGITVNLAALETNVEVGFEKLQTAIAGLSKTNWNLVISAVLLTMAVWAAAIRPVVNDVTEMKTARASDHDAIVILSTKLADTKAALDVVIERGSPITDRRLSILEMKMGTK